VWGEINLFLKTVRLFAVLAAVASIPVVSGAQQAQTPTSQSPDAQQPAPPAKPSPSTNQETPTEKEKDRGALGVTVEEKKKGDQSSKSGTSNDRLFYTLPNFLTMESKKQLPPLTVGEKFKVVTRGSFDYVQFPWYGFLSLISQAENSEPGYGQGWEGYGKRFGSAFADGTIENYLTGAILPSLLHQDPRFYQLGEGSFRHRLFYAMSRNLVTLGDSGRKEFNASEVFGGAMAAAISTYSYHPKSFISYRFDAATDTTTPVFNPSDRTLTNTAKVWGTQYAYDTLTLVVKEFWPDIRRKVSKHKQSQPAR